MGQGPAWKSVGGKALMHQRKSRLHPGVLEIDVIVRNVNAEDKPLVDHGAARNRNRIIGTHIFTLRLDDAVRSHFAGHK